MNAREAAEQHLRAVQTSESVTDWQRESDAQLGQGWALLALADAVERHTAAVTGADRQSS